RKVSRHCGTRRRAHAIRRSTGHLDSPASGAGRRSGCMALAARPQRARPERAGGVAQGLGRHCAHSRLGVRSRQARLHDVRPVRPLGISDGDGADARRMDVRRGEHANQRRGDLGALRDDTSGTEWARTRKMGVNSLAFRGPQHGAFYVADADCAAVTTAVPWSLGRQWLDLLSRSGTSLFVSLAPDALGPAQRADLRAALARAATHQPLAEPLDWRETVYPRHWRAMGATRSYDWIAPEGAGLP